MPQQKKFFIASLLTFGFILSASYVYYQQIVFAERLNPIIDTAYAAAVAQTEQEISSFSNRAKTMPNSWFALELAASSYLQRARLTGDYQDYASAEVMLGKAFELSGPAGGPHMARAGLNYSLHRLDLVEADLKVSQQIIILSDNVKASIIALRADVAFHQGHYDQALAGYQEALALDKNTSHLFRLAHYYWRTGDFKQAEAYLDQMEAVSGDTSAQLSAFIHLHRGLFDLDRGRYDQALEHYQDADQAFSGWWLIQEHIAEIYNLQGHLDEAKLLYQQIIDTTGNPEFMDALADIAKQQNKTKEAQYWLKQAQAAYENQLNQFPEAAYGHALSHYLQSAQQTEKALSLAKANFALRPSGEAATLLAQAYFQAGLTQDARELIESTLESPWGSAELHATAALIFKAAGDDTRSKLEQQKALNINPHALDNVSWLGDL